MQKAANSKHTNNRHLSSDDLLSKGMNPKRWKFKVDNKLRGAYGQTDFATKTVLINKKKHKDKKMLAKERKYHRLPDGTESIIDTIEHELGHIRKPNASEGAVEKSATKRVARMSPRAKQKTYALLNR